MNRILVVEDDPALNKTVCLYLTDFGFTVTGVHSVDEAYDQMYARPFDLIISDIMMPGTDGFAFARAVRDVNEHVPIFVYVGQR